MSYSQITVVGRLGRDPEIRMTQKGEQMVSTSIAVGSGDKSQWFKVTAMGKTAEGLAKAMKGDMAFVQGSLQIKTYDRKDGKTGVEALVWANVVRVMGGKKDSESIESAFGAKPMQPNNDVDFDQDIPF